MPRKTIPQASDLITHTSAPLTIEDVRKLPGYERISDEAARNLIYDLQQLAKILINTIVYESRK